MHPTFNMSRRNTDPCVYETPKEEPVFYTNIPIARCCTCNDCTRNEACRITTVFSLCHNHQKEEK